MGDVIWRLDNPELPRAAADKDRAGCTLMSAVRGSLPPAWRRLAAETAWNNENERLQRAIENNNARYQRALADVGRAFDEMMKDAADKVVAAARN